MNIRRKMNREMRKNACVYFEKALYFKGGGIRFRETVGGAIGALPIIFAIFILERNENIGPWYYLAMYRYEFSW